MSKVLVMDERDNLVEVIDHVFKQFQVELRGKKVMIKPNLVCAIPPGGCTNPQVVEAVVLAVLARGGQVTVGDGMSEIIKNSMNTARIAGIHRASHGCFKPIGAELKEAAKRIERSSYIKDKRNEV